MTQGDDAEGSCGCSNIMLTLTLPVAEIHVCGCSRCRRSNGSAFNLALIVRADQVNWIDRGSIQEFESSPGKYRAFCGQCGSPIYSRRADTPDVFRLRAGIFPNLPKPDTFTTGFLESAWPWFDDLLATIRYEPKELQ
jgi:hypothetical protein